MSKLAEYLNRHVVGNIFDQPAVRAAYAGDSSILSYTPNLVAIPENPNDIRKLLRFVQQLAARDLVIPVTVRGNGLDKTGASVGSGLVISMEKLNQVEEIDVRGRLVRVQPGITLGELNAVLRPQGLWLPIGYNPKATIGSLIANCPTDDMINRYGGIYHAVERAEIVLPGGDLILLMPYRPHAVQAKIASNSVEGVLYRRIEQILDSEADTILDRSMQPYDTIGYANVTHVREGHLTNLLPLMFSSQGTLGIITDVILKVELLPPEPKRLLVSFRNLKDAERFLNYANELDPYELKVFDLRILETAAELGKRSELFTRKLGKGVLVLVGFDYGRFRSAKKLKQCIDALPDNALYVEEDDGNTDDFYQITNLLTSYLNDERHGQHVALLDEVFVPQTHFTEYIEQLKVLEETTGQALPFFGSFSTSSYNIRPQFDYSTLDGRKKMIQFLRLYSDLVYSCQGSITGNSPEGRVKALVTDKRLGTGERQLYTAIKEAFDPKHILNPNVKFNVDAREILRYLRTSEKPGVIMP